MTRISKYVSLAEAVKSQTAERNGIYNLPNDEARRNMAYVSQRVFDPVRDYVGGPLAVSSFYRSPDLNRAIGGSETSQHCKGEAMDIDADVYGVGNNKQIFEFIKDNLEFDQLIWEFGTKENPAWVHVSLTRDNNRKQVLRAHRDNGYTQYDVL